MEKSGSTKIILVNLITGMRLLFAVLSIWLLFKEEVFLAFVSFAVGVMGTDGLDGYLARKWKAVTMFGKFWDSLMDKIAVYSLFFAIIIKLERGLLRFDISRIVLGVSLFFFFLLVATEIILIYAAVFILWKIKKGGKEELKEKLGSNIWGKTKMAGLCIVLIFSFIFIEKPSDLFAVVIMLLMVIVATLAFLSLRKHWLDYIEEGDNIYLYLKRFAWFRKYESLFDGGSQNTKT